MKKYFKVNFILELESFQAVFVLVMHGLPLEVCNGGKNQFYYKAYLICRVMNKVIPDLYNHITQQIWVVFSK